MCYKIRRHLRKKNIDLLNELVYDIFDEEFISTGEMLHRIRRFEGYEDVIIIFLNSQFWSKDYCFSLNSV